MTCLEENPPIFPNLENAEHLSESEISPIFERSFPFLGQSKNDIFLISLMTPLMVLLEYLIFEYLFVIRLFSLQASFFFVS